MTIITRSYHNGIFFLNLEPIAHATEKWLDTHPRIFKMVVAVNNITRTAAMIAFISAMPYAPLTNCGIALGASLFYRVTVERCPFKFSLPSCLGAIAFHVARPSLTQIINGVARQSLRDFSQAAFLASPLLFYGIGVVIISHSSVESWLTKNQPENPNCCQNKGVS